MPAHDAMTRREYAYLRIVGPGTHEHVTKVLGLRPSEAWNRGDTNPRNGKPFRSMSWTIKSDLDDTRSLHDHLDAILSVIGTRSNEIRDLWLDHELYLVCVGYYPGWTHGVALDREMVRQAANLGLAFDFDFYTIDPVFDEETGKEFPPQFAAPR